MVTAIQFRPSSPNYRPFTLKSNEAKRNHLSQSYTSNNTVFTPIHAISAIGDSNVYSQQLLKNITGILQEGQGIIKKIDEINKKPNPNESEIKDILSQINKFMKDLLEELDSQVTLDEIVQTVTNVAPSTVRIENSGAIGSGVIFKDNNGKRYILTNAHVVEDIQNDPDLSEIFDIIELKKKAAPPKEKKEMTYRIKLYNGTDYKNPIEFDAKQLSLKNGEKAFSHPDEHDLSVLEIPDNVKIPNGLGVQMRDLSKDPIQAGEPLIAIGNPLGERDSISFGIASHVDRSTDININHHIQTDAAINPGNSGGGLFDLQGRLVGINTWGYRGAAGVGGAIRIDYIKMVLEKWGISVA